MSFEAIGKTLLIVLASFAALCATLNFHGRGWRSGRSRRP